MSIQQSDVSPLLPCLHSHRNAFEFKSLSSCGALRVCGNDNFARRNTEDDDSDNGNVFTGYHTRVMGDNFCSLVLYQSSPRLSEPHGAMAPTLVNPS
jgi:hypothetical protein